MNHIISKLSFWEHIIIWDVGKINPAASAEQIIKLVSPIEKHH